jgi:hypothetical protein
LVLFMSLSALEVRVTFVNAGKTDPRLSLTGSS